MKTSSQPQYDEPYLEALRIAATDAYRKDLRDFDWMSLDLETARKVHSMLPLHPPKKPPRRSF